MLALCSVLGALTASPAGAQTLVSDQEAAQAAQALASRLAASPSAASWVGNTSRTTQYESDVSQLVTLSSVLAHELSLGKTKAETRSTYAEIRNVGKRILIRSNASPETPPADEVKKFTTLMGVLERYYTQ